MKHLLLALLFAPSLVSAEYFEIRKIVEAGAGAEVVKHAKTGEELSVSNEVIVSEKHVATAKAALSEAAGPQETSYSLQVQLSEEGEKRLIAATPAEAAGKLRLAVIIDGKVVTAPIVQTAPLGKNFVMEGGPEMKEIAAKLTSKIPEKQ